MNEANFPPRAPPPFRQHHGGRGLANGGYSQDGSNNGPNNNERGQGYRRLWAQVVQTNQFCNPSTYTYAVQSCPGLVCLTWSALLSTTLPRLRIQSLSFLIHFLNRYCVQVTQVNRGQRLGESIGSGLQFSDMTVEDLLRIIRNLSPDESAVKSVSQGLYYLDSRAVAALLKELAKCGLSNRSQELFDWLRSLEDGHELGPLCDVYTYTTIISQCGSHQQLRKALELVAEMRGRGIQCNVHTYR